MKIKKSANKMIFLFLLVKLIVVSFIPGKAVVQTDTDTKQTIPKNGTLKVVTTISLAGDWASQIGEGLWKVESIVTGLENPHTYEPTPSEIEAVADCDIFIRMGLEGLEPWVESTIDSTGLDEDKIVTLVNVSTMVEYDDVIGRNNPHVWMSPHIVKDMVDKIYEKTVEVDPSNAATYLANRNRYHSDLDSLLNRIEGNKTANFDGMKVVVHHPAFKYLFDLLGIERVASIEEQEGTEPSAEHIAEVIEKMKDEDVKVIVHQPQLEDDKVNEIARDADTQIALLTPLLGVKWDDLVVEPEELGLDSEAEILDKYIDMIDYNLVALANPFDPPEEGEEDITTFVLAGSGIAVIAILMVVFVYYRRKPA